MHRLVAMLFGSCAVCAVAVAQEGAPSERYAACRASEDGVDRRVGEICALADDLIVQRSVWDATGHPRDHARVQIALGSALFVIAQAGDEEGAYRDAIAAYQVASNYYDNPDTRARWAGVQLSMGGALIGLAQLGDEAALAQAAPTLTAGIEAIARHQQPELWASLHTSLAEAHVAHWRRSGDREQLTRAIAALQAALEIYRRARYAEQRADTEARLAELLEALAGEGTAS